MRGQCTVYPTIPAKDLERSRAFYQDVLGLEVIGEVEEDEGIRLSCGESGIYLYHTEHAGTAKHTLCSFESEDVDSEIEELRDKGVTFEQFEMEGVDFDDDGVAWMGDGGMHGVWFRDPDDNIIAMFENARVPAMG